MIPETFVGVALQAVAMRQPQEVAIQLGISTPRLVQECLRLAHDPRVFARHPRPCRIILERAEQARQARHLEGPTS